MKQTLCILLFFFSIHLFAQVDAEPSMEKLKHKLSDATDKEERLAIALNIAHDYIYHEEDNTDSALVFLEIANNLPELSHIQQLKVWQEYIYFYQFKNPVKGYDYLDSMKHLALSHPQEIGVFLRLKSFQSAGIYYSKSGDAEKSRENFETAIAIAKTDSSVKIKNALGYTYSLAAELLFTMQDTNAALAYADSSIVAFAQVNSKHLGYAYSVKANLYYQAGAISKALETGNTALEVNLYDEIPISLVHTLVCANYKIGNYTTAMQNAFDFASGGIEGWQKNNSRFINNVLFYGHKAAEKLGDNKTRLFLMEAQIAYFDEILKETSKLNSLSQYTQKIAKEQQALLLQQKDELIQLEGEKKQRQQWVSVVFLLGFLVLLILVAIVFNRLKLTRVQKKIIEQEQEKSEHLLLNILPYEIAQELKNTNTSPAKSFPIATVLFTDFVGFTKLANQLSPVELLSTLNEYFLAFDTIMERHGVEKIKTIGDAYMAVGGIPIQKDNHALSVIKSAVEIIDFVEQTKQRKIREGKPYFEIRIGIHSGSLVAGIVGKTKFAYDVWGDAVNLASRLESNSKPGKINISADTYHLVKHQFNCTYRGKLKAKGLGIQDMYFVEVGRLVSNDISEFIC